MNDLGDGTLFELPGPSNWAQSIANEAARGNSVVVLLPDHFAETDAGGDIADLAHLLGCEELSLRSDLPLEESLIDHVGSDGTEPARGDLLAHVVQWSAMKNRRLLIRAWQSPTDEAIKRWPQTVHAAGLPPDERPALIVVARLRDLDVAAAERITLSEIRTTWWWGAVGHLDTELTVARTAPHLDRLQRAAVAQLAAWDLGDARALASTWDGDMRSLRRMAGEILTAVDVPHGGTNLSKPRRSPTPHLFDSWSAGCVDTWDGRLRFHADTLSDEGFARSLWHAQARVLLPSLEEARYQIEEDLIRRLPSAILTSLDHEVRDDGLPEFAAMRRVLRKHGYQIDLRTWKLISAAIPVRNSLAHMRPVMTKDLEQLLRWLPLE